jgi:putative S-layer protein / peptidoglycan endo-beta-N-acetylglucosaminidase
MEEHGKKQKRKGISRWKSWHQMIQNRTESHLIDIIFHWILRYNDKNNIVLKTLFSFILCLMPAWVSAQDILPGEAKADVVAVPLINDSMKQQPVFDGMTYAEDYPEAEIVPELELNLENLSDVLDQYGIKFKKIVMAQALLETGNFTSNVCLTIHNIFGLRRPSDGSYFEFPNWMDCVRAYRDAVQYKYISGDYYAFLDRIGYAEDKAYTSKVRRIARTL